MNFRKVDSDKGVVAVGTVVGEPELKAGALYNALNQYHDMALTAYNGAFHMEELVLYRLDCGKNIVFTSAVNEDGDNFALIIAGAEYILGIKGESLALGSAKIKGSFAELMHDANQTPVSPRDASFAYHWVQSRVSGIKMLHFSTCKRALIKEGIIKTKPEVNNLATQVMSMNESIKDLAAFGTVGAWSEVGSHVRAKNIEGRKEFVFNDKSPLNFGDQHYLHQLLSSVFDKGGNKNDK